MGKFHIMKFANYRSDKENLALIINKSYNEVDYLYRVGRLSQNVFEAFCWLWANKTKVWDCLECTNTWSENIERKITKNEK